MDFSRVNVSTTSVGANQPVNDSQQLQALIRGSIPLSDFMQFEITDLSATAIQTSAALHNNINNHGTAFAGSLYSLAMLTAWAMLAHCLRQHAIDAELVAARAEIQYRRPVTGPVECRVSLDSSMIDSFIGQLGRKGRARMPIEVNIGDRAASMQAQMVATVNKP